MRRTILLNAAWYSALVFVWLGHVTFVVPHVPDSLALLLNIGLVPFLIGCAAQLLLKASLLVKIVLVAMLPVVDVFVFGGDPAKPGVEIYVALAVGAAMLLGVLLCFAFSKLQLRRASPP